MHYITESHEHHVSKIYFTLIDMAPTHVTAWQYFQTPPLLPYIASSIPSMKTISLDNEPSGLGIEDLIMC